MRKTKALEVIKKSTPKIQIIEKDEVTLNGKTLERGKDYTIAKENGQVVLNSKLLETMKNQSNITYSSYVYSEIRGKNEETKNNKKIIR